MELVQPQMVAMEDTDHGRDVMLVVDDLLLDVILKEWTLRTRSQVGVISQHWTLPVDVPTMSLVSPHAHDLVQCVFFSPGRSISLSIGVVV